MAMALCVICGDFSSGKHYGAQTCLGCKQFFQRTVRDGSVYVCRFDGRCEIAKERRNICRYCRFNKCLYTGMKREAVQEKRDKRGSTINRHQLRSPEVRLATSTPFTLDLLFQAETSAKFKVSNMCPEVIVFANVDQAVVHHAEIPNIGAHDFYTMMKLELHMIVEWAKELPGFKELRVPDQVALIKAHGAELITLEILRRSMETNGFLVTLNGRKISRDGNLRIRHEAIELLKPCKRLKPSNHEFFCLKALIIFDPETKGLSATEKGRVEAVRKHVQKLLAESCFHDIQRISDLLLFIPKVHIVGVMLTKVVKMHAAWWKDDQAPKLVDDIFLKDHEDNTENYDAQPSTSDSLMLQSQSHMEPVPSYNVCPPDPSEDPLLFGDSNVLIETIVRPFMGR